MTQHRIIAAAAFAAAVCIPAVHADDAVTKMPIDQQWMISKGGRLYDNWFGQLSIDPPPMPAPTYPPDGQVQLEHTWRCPVCHGWDYRGKDGEYGKKGSDEYTGIKGIQAYKGRSNAQISAVLRNATHGYTREMIPDSEMEALAMFVSIGQTDYTKFFDDKGKPKGDVAKGKRQYQLICAECHGSDGKSFNLGSKRKPRYIGTIANNLPRLTLHKIRYGQPGVGMMTYGEFFERVASGDLMKDQDMVDVLAYTQTLPVE